MTETTPEPSTELALRTTPQPHEVPAIPSSQEFQLILRQADIISRSGIVPTAYRSTVNSRGEVIQDKRPNVVVATMMGRTFGWDLLTAMRNIHVIEGAATLKPEALLGLVRARGHRVKIVRSTDKVTVYARRADTGDDMSAEFSFADAVRAGLCTIGENGMPRARSKEGKPLPWEQYPLDMCQWRAVAIVARGLFSDITLGLGYLPEELGAIVDAEGDVVIETAPMPTSPSSPEAPTEQPAAEAQAPAAAQQQAEPEETPEAPARPDPASYEDEMERVQELRKQRNSRRRGPELRQAQGRSWDALGDLQPNLTDQQRIAETKQLMEAMNVTTKTATVEHWDALTEQWEQEKDREIAERWGRNPDGTERAEQPALDQGGQQ